MGLRVMPSSVRARGWKGQTECKRFPSRTSQKSICVEWEEKPRASSCLCVLIPTPRIVHTGRMSDWFRQNHNLLAGTSGLQRENMGQLGVSKDLQEPEQFWGGGGEPLFILCLSCAGSVRISHLLCLMVGRQRHGISRRFRREDLPGSLSIWGVEDPALGSPQHSPEQYSGTQAPAGMGPRCSLRHTPFHAPSHLTLPRGRYQDGMRARFPPKLCL